MKADKRKHFFLQLIVGKRTTKEDIILFANALEKMLGLSNLSRIENILSEKMDDLQSRFEETEAQIKIIKKFTDCTSSDSIDLGESITTGVLEIFFVNTKDNPNKWILIDELKSNEDISLKLLQITNKIKVGEKIPSWLLF